MPLVVLPVLIADVDPVYDVYFEAFKDEPIIDFLFPGGVDRKAHKEGTVHWWNQDKVGHTIKCVDTNTGDVVGMATWEILWRPGDENAYQVPPGIPWLQGKEKERCEDVLRPMWEMREKLFGKKRHIYLQGVAVDPKHQRRGIGRLLMQWGINVADQAGLPIYTESSVPGLPLYLNTGFERLTHVSLVHKAQAIGKPEDVEIPLVVKMPSKANGMSFKEWSDKGSPDFE